MPSDHQVVTPYCMVNNASEFINFTQDAFDAELVTTVESDEDSGAVIHGEIQIKNCTVMFADAAAAGINCGPDCVDPENDSPTIQLILYVEDADDSHERALDSGATSVMDVTDQGDNRMGGVVDPFNNLWWVKSMK